jgi:DNA-binding GntR family transcriptional regulator
LRDLTHQAYQALRQRILDGVYRPSESLTVVALAAELGVSRNTVRKALLKLESEKLVVIEENKRTRVRWFSAEEVMQYLEVREVLEGLVVRQSAPLLGKGELKEMRTILGSMKECIRTHDFAQYTKHNWQFHEIVYRACPNRPAVEMIMVIKNQLKRFNIKTILIQGRGSHSMEEHDQILSALEQQDAEAAERHMRRHVAGLRAVLQRHFDFLQ